MASVVRISLEAHLQPACLVVLLLELHSTQNWSTGLATTINIQRGPLGGRGFESYSEDPLLSGTLAGAYCNGIQEKDTIACLKHFVCNDQEHERMAVNSILTDRALREIYLFPFMTAIKAANPGSIMTAYNRVNGVHGECHKLTFDELVS